MFSEATTPAASPMAKLVQGKRTACLEKEETFVV